MAQAHRLSAGTFSLLALMTCGMSAAGATPRTTAIPGAPATAPATASANTSKANGLRSSHTRPFDHTATVAIDSNKKAADDIELTTRRWLVEYQSQAAQDTHPDITEQALRPFGVGFL